MRVLIWLILFLSGSNTYAECVRTTVYRAMGGAAAHVPRAWPQCEEVVPRCADELFPLTAIVGHYKLYLRETKINDMSMINMP